MGKRFGLETLRMVEGVTKEIHPKAMEHHRAENIRKVLLATTKDFRVILIKLADRLHNMRTLKYLPPSDQQEIAKETLEIYVPIAYKLGMYKIKSDLEDLSLRFLQPEIYQQLKKKVATKKGRREHDVKKMIQAVRRLLGEIGVEARVYGRAKNFYGIYKKMVKKHLEFEEIRDLSAVRVIVKTQDDCYKVLEAIHTKWEPVPDGFDDFIKSPKPNLYQSLHTEIIFNKNPIEVQIRTAEMHHVAEEGIAAHWQYKGTERDKKFDRKIGWLKQILDWRRAETAQALVESFKIDIFKDEIYVLTPKGDPLPLPEKSTPIDFAFAVHSEIGNHCRAAKVNGEIQPLDYELNSGDVVDIITAKNAKPSRQWLKFVKTSYAREKIRKALGITGEPTKRSDRISSTEGISTKEKLPLRLVRCCYIRERDDMVGQKTKDAIFVHSKRCEVAERIPDNKRVKLGWKQLESKKVLELELKDRIGIFADILGTLTAGDIRVYSVDTKSVKKRLRMILEIGSDEEHLNKALPKIKQVRDVISVKTA